MASKALCCLAITYILSGSISLAYGQQSTPAELLRETLALQRDIFALEQTVSNAVAPDRIIVILDVDGQPPFSIDRVQLAVDGATVADLALSQTDNQALTSGAMMALYQGRLAAGKHALTATVTTTHNDQTQRQKRFKIEKSAHAETYRLTISNPLLRKPPGLSLQRQHRGATP